MGTLKRRNKMKKNVLEQKKFTLRINKELKSEVEKKAKELNISLNSMIKIILREYIQKNY